MKPQEEKRTRLQDETSDVNRTIIRDRAIAVSALRNLAKTSSETADALSTVWTMDIDGADWASPDTFNHLDHMQEALTEAIRSTQARLTTFDRLRRARAALARVTPSVPRETQNNVG